MGVKKFISALSKPFQREQWSALSPIVWIALRPKAAFDWYRMWGTRPVISWLKAADLFIKKDFALAAHYYQKGLAKHAKHPARHCARMDLGYCLYRTNRPEAALAELSLVTETSAALRDAYLLKAKIEDLLGKSQLAVCTLSDALILFPQDLKLLVGFVHTCLFNSIQSSRLPEVRSLLLQHKRELLLDDLRQVMVDAALAHYELKLGDVESGDRMLVRVLATGNAPLEAVLVRGQRLLEQKRLLQAREQLGRAMRLAPRSSRPLRLLAESYLAPGDLAEIDWAEQLAVSACKLSAWQNRDDVKVYAKVMDEKGDTSTSELLMERSADLSERLQIEFEGALSKRQRGVPYEVKQRVVKLGV